MSVPGSDAVSCINSWESKARKKASEGWVAWEESFLTNVGIEARSSESQVTEPRSETSAQVSNALAPGWLLHPTLPGWSLLESPR